MRKIIFLLIISISLILIGCEKTTKEPIGFQDGVIVADIFSNNHFITYAVSYNYTNDKEYYLELSVNIPNNDGTSTKKVLKGSYIKAKDDTKVLSDSILVEDVVKQLSSDTSVDFKDLEYNASMYNVIDGEIADGAGVTTNLYIRE